MSEINDVKISYGFLQCSIKINGFVAFTAHGIDKKSFKALSMIVVDLSDLYNTSDHDVDADRDFRKFLFCVSSLFAKAAISDGQLNEDETEFIYEFIEHLCDKEPGHVNLEDMCKSAFQHSIKNKTDPNSYSQCISDFSSVKNCYRLFLIT